MIEHASMCLHVYSLMYTLWNVKITLSCNCLVLVTKGGCELCTTHIQVIYKPGEQFVQSEYKVYTKCLQIMWKPLGNYLNHI